MSCWVLTSPYTPQGSEHYFSVKQQEQRDHSSSHRKGGLENGSTQDWEARTGRRWFQEPRAPLLQKSLLWTYHYATLWNILFWPQNTSHMTLKWIIQVCTASTEKEAPYVNCIFPTDCTVSATYTSAECRNEGKICFCCSWGHPGGDAGQGTTGSGAVWREDLNCKDKF